MDATMDILGNVVIIALMAGVYLYYTTRFRMRRR